MKISHLLTALSVPVLVLALSHHFAAVGNAKIRIETFESQQLAEKLQSQISARRQQLQSQQETLSKKSSIGDTVGPAVVSDVLALAEKSGDPKLRDLLAKYGVRVAATAAPAASAVPTAPNPAKKGGN